MSAALQFVMPFAPAISYRPEDFIRGPANAVALDLVEQWPAWPYSLVLAYGPKGSGKTHLAHVFAARAQAVFIAPGRVGSVPADQLLAGSHSWVIDGIEQVRNEAALAQLINHARARGDYMMLTTDRAPAQMEVKLPDLMSRLKALPTLRLGEPDDALMAAVLAKAFADRQIRVGGDIVQYAVTHMERSFEAAQGLAEALDNASLAKGRKISLNMVKELIKE